MVTQKDWIIFDRSCWHTICKYALIVALIAPATVYGQCTEDIQSGVYWIKVTNEDNSQWCLDRDRFDGNHVKLVFSACLHPESERFELTDPGNSHGCYQIRPLAESSGANYHLLAVISGPEADQRGWTPILSSFCPSFGGNCSQNFQTWTIHRIENGSFEIKSNVPVQGYPHGFCLDKRDDSGEGAPEPQFLDCRKNLHQQFWFVPDVSRRTELMAHQKGPSGYICQAGKTWICKEPAGKGSPRSPQGAKRQ